MLIVSFDVHAQDYIISPLVGIKENNGTTIIIIIINFIF